jgi:predicted DsbA family dithiol-disulfide isomerase
MQGLRDGTAVPGLERIGGAPAASLRHPDVALRTRPRALKIGRECGPRRPDTATIEERRRRMRIEVIYDPSCPWCYIGKRQLERAMMARPGRTPRLRWWPFLLNPDMPTEGVDRTGYLVRKFGSEARVSRIFRAIAHVGLSVEIDFAFERIGRAPNTINAHRLVRYAERFGRADAAVEALFHSHFVRGLDIGHDGVLADIGREIGLPHRALRDYLSSDTNFAAVCEDNARAHRLGINGVPAFVLAGEFVICGAQDPKVLERMLDVAAAAEGHDFALPHRPAPLGAY